MKAFYGKEIDLAAEQAAIEKILLKYRQQPVSEELKKSVYVELCAAKERGEIHIPFKVVMRKGMHGKKHDYIEILLDTKL